MELLNIIVLENEPSSRRGGQELSLLEVCRGLHAKGHSLTFLYTQPGDLLPDYEKISKRILKVHAYQLEPKRSPAAWFRFLSDVLRVPVEVGSVIYSNQYHDTLFGSALSFLKRVPFVCHLRLKPPSPFCGEWKLGLKGVKHFIAISDNIKNEWSKRGFDRAKIERVYNGVDLNKFVPSVSLKLSRQRLRLGETDPVISFVGRLDRVKGIEVLLKAAQSLLLRGKKFKLILAGKPHDHATPAEGIAYQRELEAMAQKLTGPDCVHFVGHIADPILIYQASDVLVLPSVEGEAFGRVLVEAMACGIPAVGSRVGGIPEVLSSEFSKFLFETGNTESLAEILNGVLDWRHKDPRLGARCRQWVGEKFPFSSSIEGIEGILKDTLKKS